QSGQLTGHAPGAPATAARHGLTVARHWRPISAGPGESAGDSVNGTGGGSVAAVLVLTAFLASSVASAQAPVPSATAAKLPASAPAGVGPKKRIAVLKFDIGANTQAGGADLGGGLAAQL